MPESYLQIGINRLNDLVRAVDDVCKCPEGRVDTLLRIKINRLRAAYEAYSAPVGAGFFSPEKVEELIKSSDSFKNHSTAQPRSFFKSPLSPTPTPPPEPVEDLSSLKGDQPRALSSIRAWLKTTQPFFILKGVAGTGKTHLMKYVAKTKGYRFVFCAPTNKACKVLSLSLGEEVKTIYSFLGLRMVEDEDRMVLQASSDTPYIAKGTVLVLDEGSMVGEQLLGIIKDLTEKGLRVIISGDPMQLPPVGELRSPCWRMNLPDDCKESMTHVVRYDNQILTLASDIRKCIGEKDWDSPLSNNHKHNEGVFLIPKADFLKEIKSLQVSDWTDAKVVCWRNKTVNKYNSIIRRALGFEDPYNVGERVLMAEVVEVDNRVIAHVDEEFEVTDVKFGLTSKIDESTEIAVTQITVKGDKTLTLLLPEGDDLELYLSKLSKQARGASGRERSELWRQFWNTKKRFHKVRYGYALTAHRVQGSTYKTIYVDQEDILCNSQKREAFKCLYVATTRPTTRLVSF